MKRTPLRIRFEMKISKTDDCWLWIGAVKSNGYGVIGEGGRRGRTLHAHRAAYELYVGPISTGMHVNPDHLEVVTQQENNKRSNHLRWHGVELIGR